MKRLLLFSILFLGFIALSNAQGCGQLFYDSGGPTGNFSNNEDITTTICPDGPGEQVTVTFLTFGMEANMDGLYIYDGNSTSAPQISSGNGIGITPATDMPGAYWGFTLPGPFVSSSPDGCLTFRFRSDNTANFTGWSAQVSCAIEECFKPTGLSATPLSPMTIQFGWMPVGPATSWEVLALPCGAPAPTAASNGIITDANPYNYGGLQPSTCYSFYVRTVCSDTDVSLWAGPFNATTTWQPPVCGGSFIDSGGPTGNYNNNSNQVMTICPVNPGDSVTVTFTSFSTETSWDGMYVYDGDNLNDPPILSMNGGGNGPSSAPGAFWGTAIPGPFTSTSPDGCLTFRFVSDGTNTASGWVANVTCGLAFTPLVTFIDTNENGTMDTGEIPFPYGSFTYEANNSGDVHTVSTPSGMYFLYTNNLANTFDLDFTVDPEYAAYFSATTNYTNVSIPAPTEIYFPVTLLQPYVDTQANIVSWSSPRPGMAYSVNVIYTNLGVSPASGTVTFTKDPLVSIQNTSEPGATLTASGFTYDFTNLAPFEMRQIWVSMLVPAIPTVNLGDILTTSATVTIPAGDINLTNNSFTDSQTVVGSYDPNDKKEAHGGRIVFNDFDADDYLYYTIRFQNTGTAEAFNVRVEDAIDAQIDETSIRTLSASHEYVMERMGTDITWTFNNINLPGESQNEPASHGYILFKARLKPGFAIGDIIPNTAEIYFDSNPAIVTDPCLTEFVNQLATPEFSASNIRIYPNPASSVCEIKLDSNVTIATVTIFDMLGKAVQKRNNVGSNQTALDVSGLAKGVYQLEIITGINFRHVSKLIVQ